LFQGIVPGWYTDLPYFRRCNQTNPSDFMPDQPNDLPPFVRSWPQLYAIVVGALVVEMILFYVLMRWLS
jgi:hypothetical protein